MCCCGPTTQNAVCPFAFLNTLPRAQLMPVFAGTLLNQTGFRSGHTLHVIKVKAALCTVPSRFPALPHTRTHTHAHSLSLSTPLCLSHPSLVQAHTHTYLHRLLIFCCRGWLKNRDKGSGPSNPSSPKAHRRAVGLCLEPRASRARLKTCLAACPCSQAQWACPHNHNHNRNRNRNHNQVHNSSSSRDQWEEACLAGCLRLR